MYVSMSVPWCTWEVRGQFVGGGSPSFYRVGPRDGIQVTMLRSKCLFLLDHLANPKVTFLKKFV